MQTSEEYGFYMIKKLFSSIHEEYGCKRLQCCAFLFCLEPLATRSFPQKKTLSDFFAVKPSGIGLLCKTPFLEKLYRIFMEGFVSDFYFRVRIRLLCEGAYQIGSLDLSKGLRSVHSRFICRGFQIYWLDDTDDDRDDVVLVGDDDLSHHKIDSPFEF